MFLSAVWTLILTAPIHCRGSIAEQISPSISKDGLGWSAFLAYFHFWMNYFFMLSWRNPNLKLRVKFISNLFCNKLRNFFFFRILNTEDISYSLHPLECSLLCIKKKDTRREKRECAEAAALRSVYCLCVCGLYSEVVAGGEVHVISLLQ